ncbi:MAG: c-type cytochrome [Gammaproteobacteria bacterium]|nr:c-type cytochrome [Gammaproteobacteria bacterium]
MRRININWAINVVSLLLGCVCSQSVFANNGTNIEKGLSLYQQHCFVCHDSEGRGGVGTPLSLSSFINSVDDHYLSQTIRLGRPGRVMPAFESLGTKNIGYLIDYMRSWTGIRPAAFPSDPVSGNTKNGQMLYQKHCANCHGKNGQGGQGTGVTFSRTRDLPIMAPALNNKGFLQAARDTLIEKTLTEGRQGTPMTSFTESGLTKKEIKDIVAFIRTFETTSEHKENQIKLASESPVIVRESSYDLDQTVENLKNSVIGHNLKLIRVQQLDQGFVPENSGNKKQIIVYSCGFNFLYEALKTDPRVGLFLPCRVTVVEHKGKVLVMSVNPKRMSALFNNNELDDMCNQMHDTYIDIIEEAIL